jgi:hypothetical protein
METSEKTDLIATALAAFHGEMENPDPNRTAEIEGKSKRGNDFKFNFPYTDLNGITGATRKLLAAHGLTITQEVVSAAGHIGAGLLLLHTSGQWIQYAPAMLPIDGDDPKAWGGIATSSRRMSLMAVLYLATPSDDDGRGSGKRGGGGQGKASAAQIALVKGEAADRAKVTDKQLREHMRTAYNLHVAEGIDIDKALALLTKAQASELIERLKAEAERRANAAAAGVDPDTGEVIDGDDDIGFEGEDAPGMDVAAYRASRETAAPLGKLI